MNGSPHSNKVLTVLSSLDYTLLLLVRNSTHGLNNFSEIYLTISIKTARKFNKLEIIYQNHMHYVILFKVP